MSLYVCVHFIVISEESPEYAIARRGILRGQEKATEWYGEQRRWQEKEKKN